MSRAQPASPLQVQTKRLYQNQAAERQAIASKDSLGLAEAYYQYGRTYVFAGNYQASQGYFLKALRILEPRGHSQDLSRIYVRLSENEGRLGRYVDAMRHARLALMIAQRSQSLMALGRAYGIMARVQEDRWDDQVSRNRAAYDSILYYYQQQERVFKALNDTLGLSETNLELGTLLTKVKDPRAIPYLKKALNLITLLGRDRMKVNVLIHTAEAYRTFGQLPLAFRTLRRAEQIYVANRADEYDTTLGLEEEYIRCYQLAGQWKQAFRHQQRKNAIMINQLRSDRDGTIARLNVEYETEKKEALLRTQNNKLTLEAERRQTQERFTLATSILFLVASGTGLTFFRLNRKNQRISRQNETLVREQNHRVKNNLQTVSSLLGLQASRLTDRTAKRAIEESRLRIESMAILHRKLYDGEVLAAVDLGEFVRDVTGEVLNTFGYSFLPVQYAVEPLNLSADIATPLGLILNELITNVCKYAFPRTANPVLHIRCRRNGGRLTVEVTDNGPGFDSASVQVMQTDELLPPRNPSFGMTLIQTQVAQLKGAGGFSVPPGGGTRFTLAFNL